MGEEYASIFMGKMAKTLHEIVSCREECEYPGEEARKALSGFRTGSNLSPAESLRRMRDASNEFYGMATSTGCHAFIEFAGLMHEFIQVCEAAEKQGLDWRQANTHTGVSLPFAPHHIDYLNDKLGCIYQGLSFAAQPGETKQS